MTGKVLHPAHPERICWGCDKFCPADSLACGNGTIRTQHPCELFGEDWLEWMSDEDAVDRRVVGSRRGHGPAPTTPAG